MIGFKTKELHLSPIAESKSVFWNHKPKYILFDNPPTRGLPVFANHLYVKHNDDFLPIFLEFRLTYWVRVGSYKELDIREVWKNIDMESFYASITCECCNDVVVLTKRKFELGEFTRFEDLHFIGHVLVKYLENNSVDSLINKLIDSSSDMQDIEKRTGICYATTEENWKNGIAE